MSAAKNLAVSRELLEDLLRIWISKSENQRTLTSNLHERNALRSVFKSHSEHWRKMSLNHDSRCLILAALGPHEDVKPSIWRDYLEGAALALNPLPKDDAARFFTSDVDALNSDWNNVQRDFLEAILKQMDTIEAEHGGRREEREEREEPASGEFANQQ